MQVGNRRFAVYECQFLSTNSAALQFGVSSLANDLFPWKSLLTGRVQIDFVKDQGWLTKKRAITL